MADFDWWPDPEEQDGTWGHPGRTWPKEVPVLSAKNIRQDGSLGDGDCRCLLGWSAGFPERFVSKVDAVLFEIIEERYGEGWLIEDFSDSEDPEIVADVWNEAMRRKNYAA